MTSRTIKWGRALVAAVIGATGLLAGLGTLSAPAHGESVLRVANMGEPATLDPQLVSGTWENRIVGDMFLGLMTEDAAGKAVLGAAQSYKISNGGLTYTFKIRPHTWSDGVPVTADDFVFSLRRILNPATAAEYASLLYPIKNAEAVNTGKMKPDALGVKAIDANTLRIDLSGPTPYFLGLLTHYTAWPVPKHVIEKWGKAWIKPGHIVSNGPYVLDKWVPNSYVKLKKNPKFYDAANVHIDRVVYYPQEDRAAAQKRFRAGEIDVDTDISSGQINWLRANMASDIRIAPYLGTYYYVVNTTKKPFTDVRVRRALSMAINRKVIVDKVLKTGEIAAYSFVPPGVDNYGTPSYVTWKDMPYAKRLAEAKTLLKAAGFGPDHPLKLTLSYNTSENHKRIAVAVAAMWKGLDVQTELYNAEAKVHYANLKQGKFQVARAGWIADYNDAQDFLYLLDSHTGALNYGRYKDASFDRLMAQAAQTVDLKKRADVMRQAEAIAMADQPVMPIYYYISKELVSPRVKGWIDNTKDIHRTRWLTLTK
ncbi:peptide ABC transporter substrate-binding protein [Varunaivibrio sulfuroxidans]|uniref:Oligopeptide transport system substrate-binding protein n=1 Tax=Varunaivibrio sulfuroxidans TaxID=1773489 RepID=A0A4R3J6W4_9PROT|nr:peptide ABC transporter substrate-binding protein [Varunaivibrio sulfuroxidans]TCS60596.1 oligopeptide transport system substrate-binding protein [Varunaivibrio sulfuroxidans]WES30086.1 peptide ABC transporter substrate-binding protein [Varunaivibrio sulfuroxidans]